MASSAAARSLATSAASPVLDSWTSAPPSSSLSNDSPVKVSTMLWSAHEGVGILGHHDLVGQTEQERRSRQDRPGGGDEHRYGPRAAGQRARSSAPAVQCGHAFMDVGAADDDTTATKGIARRRA